MARKATLGWLDSERNEDCAFQLASDNQLRCLPVGQAVLRPNT